MADPRRRGVLVLGLARSGRAAAAALARAGVEVVAADRSAGADAGRLAAEGVEVRLGSEEESLLEGVELVVKSPGVPAESPLAAAARAARSRCGARSSSASGCCPGNPFVGVTGTNGKTTTTELLGGDLPRARRGRSRSPGTSAARSPTSRSQVEPGTTIVCELSSFQLEDVHTLACDVAVLLNLEPDHLDRHGTFEAYRDAKLRIFERARVEVVPRGLGLARHRVRGRRRAACRAPHPRRAQSRERRRGDGRRPRRRREDEAIAEALRTFPGVEHRLELVRELDGVRYVNDSKATNTAAARRGVAAYDAPLRLILGGSLKGEDFAPFARDLPANVRSVYLIGEAADELARRSTPPVAHTAATATSRTRWRTRTPSAAGRHRPPLARRGELRPVRRTSRSAATRFRRLVEDLA